VSDWIRLTKQAPPEEADILYVVQGNDWPKPFVVRGMRCYVTNRGWRWCDIDGVSDVLGNDGENSFVRYWMHTPKAPRIRKPRGHQ